MNYRYSYSHKKLLHILKTCTYNIIRNYYICQLVGVYKTDREVGRSGWNYCMENFWKIYGERIESNSEFLVKRIIWLHYLNRPGTDRNRPLCPDTRMLRTPIHTDRLYYVYIYIYRCEQLDRSGRVDRARLNSIMLVSNGCVWVWLTVMTER